MGVALLGAISFVPIMQMTARPAAASFGATLLLDGGTAQVLRHGAATSVTAAGGESVMAGDTVQAGPVGSVRLLYSGGTMTTLEMGARVILSELRTDARSAFHIRIRQEAGRTWNRVVRLVAGSGYAVDGPNNAVAEVRGTEFAVSIATDPGDLLPVVTVDLASGVLDVSGGGRTIRLEAGASTTLHGAAAPAPPVPSRLQPPVPPPVAGGPVLVAHPLAMPVATPSPAASTGPQNRPAASAAKPAPSNSNSATTGDHEDSKHEATPAVPSPSPAARAARSSAGEGQSPSPSTSTRAKSDDRKSVRQADREGKKARDEDGERHQD